MRLATLSYQPPRKPEVTPTRTPRLTAMTVAATPTSNDVRAP